MSQEGDPPIIIQGGGSISINFNDQAFQPAAGGGFSSGSLNITRVEVVISGQTVLDESLKDGDATVKVYYS